jgi:hypothetical protein
MTTGVLTRSFLLAGVGFVAVCPARSASADPIVFGVGNAAFASVFVSGLDPVALVNDGTSDPLHYLVALNANGASAMSRLNLVSDITGTRLVSHADLLATASSGSSEIRASADAEVNSGAGITLTAPYTYTYTLQSSRGAATGVGHAELFASDLLGNGAGETAFRDSLNPGAFTAEHSGILQPGFYIMQAVLQVFQESGSSGTANGSFDFTLELTPAPAPTPEPATLALFGTGLVGVAARAWRRKNTAP